MVILSKSKKSKKVKKVKKVRSSQIWALLFLLFLYGIKGGPGRPFNFLRISDGSSQAKPFKNVVIPDEVAADQGKWLKTVIKSDKK